MSPDEACQEIQERVAFRRDVLFVSSRADLAAVVRAAAAACGTEHLHVHSPGYFERMNRALPIFAIFADSQTDQNAMREARRVGVRVVSPIALGEPIDEIDVPIVVRSCQDVDAIKMILMSFSDTINDALLSCTKWQDFDPVSGIYEQRLISWSDTGSNEIGFRLVPSRKMIFRPHPSIDLLLDIQAESGSIVPVCRSVEWETNFGSRPVYFWRTSQPSQLRINLISKNDLTLLARYDCETP